MPRREWNERQWEALDRLAGLVDSQNRDRHPLAVADPFFRDVNLSRFIQGGGTVVVHRIIASTLDADVNQRARGAGRGSVYLDKTRHSLYIREQSNWVFVGPTRDYELQSPDVEDRSDEPITFTVVDNRWRELDTSERSINAPVAIRRLSDERIAEIGRAIQERIRLSPDIFETRPESVTIENSRGLIARDQAGNNIGITIGSSPAGQMPFCYLVIVEGYGQDARYEILCGPLVPAVVRTELDKLGRAGYPERLAIKRFERETPASLCRYCLRPNIIYKHQAHCPRGGVALV